MQSAKSKVQRFRVRKSGKSRVRRFSVRKRGTRKIQRFRVRKSGKWIGAAIVGCAAKRTWYAMTCEHVLGMFADSIALMRVFVFVRETGLRAVFKEFIGSVTIACCHFVARVAKVYHRLASL